MNAPKLKLIERLFTEHAGALQQFFRRRLRRQWEAPDLTQEVYTRMLRVNDYESIENPEAYLFTVATNLLRERAVIEQKRITESVHLVSPEAMPALTLEPPSAEDIDRDARLARLREAVADLPPKLQAVLVWTFEEGATQEEIGRRLGVSRRMARKHLAAAMEHCRRRMMRREARRR
jgi:RNA polymerase sigma factor (sigma-70 family)